MTNNNENFKESNPNNSPYSPIHIINTIKPTASAFNAIIFHISKLMPFNREPKKVEFALEQAIQIFKPLNGTVLKLKNHNIVCIVQNNAFISVDRCISQFKRSLPNDPILQDSLKKDQFCSIYDLGLQWNNFYQAVEDVEYDPIYSVLKTQSDGTTTQLFSQGIDLSTVNNIENMLKNSDLLSYLKRQNIYWYDGKDIPRKIASHFYISVQALEEALSINESIMGNIWLFKHISGLLDQKTLSFLPSFLNLSIIESIHLNINLRSIVSSHFHKFFTNFNKEKPMSFCIDIIDYLAHPDALIFARDFLTQKGCRVIISGISAHHLDVISFENVPASVFKINSSPGLIERKDKLKALVDKLGPYKVILHQCDSEREIQEGLDCGIEQFQGHGLDKLRDPSKI